ncbi:hypothetical protein XELAEV_18023529mg [Xenopus laevis]|uniref:Uncharacterized protein n=1 Tax=Xenopus laevis TaxID=8355 RepID=A0A974D726_XENLA|nr:hypothetical protein XELAEV_18023529mg [Xenopus laevis]
MIRQRLGPAPLFPFTPCPLRCQRVGEGKPACCTPHCWCKHTTICIFFFLPFPMKFWKRLEGQKIKVRQE